MKRKSDNRLATSDFECMPISEADGSIRIIRVLPDLTPEGLIHCQISQTTIHKGNEYTCLSYVWGSSNEPRTIRITEIVDGRSTIWTRTGTQSVRRNLWEFLNVARSKYTEQNLWIDALCINQEDTEERNQQVQQMGEIYHSRNMIAWLGNSHLIARYFDVLKTELEEIDAGLLAQDGDYERGGKEFAGNEYWSRAWVTQELQLTSKKTLLAGNSDIQLRTILAAWGNNGDAKRSPVESDSSDEEDSGDENVFLPNHHNPYLAAHFRQWTAEDCDDPIAVGDGFEKLLVELINDYHRQRCAVISDRIYSLLSLCSPSERENLAVDYGLDECGLFLRTMHACAPPLCFCSVASVARALNILSSRDYQKDIGMLKHGLRFKVEAHPPAEKCFICGHWLPVAFRQKRGHVFCFFRACTDKGGHLFLEAENSIEEVLDKCLQRRIYYQPQRWWQHTVISCTQAMNIRISRCPEPGHYYVCFSYSTMVKLLRWWIVDKKAKRELCNEGLHLEYLQKKYKKNPRAVKWDLEEGHEVA